MQTTSLSRVLGIALRSARSEPMVEVRDVSAITDGNLVGDHSKGATPGAKVARPSYIKRGITLLSASQWADTVAEMGLDLPWHTRRANVLVDAPSLQGWIGKKIRIGEIEVLVNGITYPCAHIEWMQPGLLKALSGERGGVYGRIVKGGMLRVGDEVRVV